MATYEDVLLSLRNTQTDMGPPTANARTTPPESRGPYMTFADFHVQKSDPNFNIEDYHWVCFSPSGYIENYPMSSWSTPPARCVGVAHWLSCSFSDDIADDFE